MRRRSALSLARGFHFCLQLQTLQTRSLPREKSEFFSELWSASSKFHAIEDQLETRGCLCFVEEREFKCPCNITMLNVDTREHCVRKRTQRLRITVVLRCEFAILRIPL